MSASKPWAAIMAVDEAGVIGKAGKLPWRCSGDLKQFATITENGVLVMGRKTYEGVGDLKGRHTIVLSHRTVFNARGKQTTIWANSLDAIPDRHFGKQIWICGGRQVYEAAFPKCCVLMLSVIEGKHDGDTMAPDYEKWFKFDGEVMKGTGFRMERWVAK